MRILIISTSLLMCFMSVGHTTSLFEKNYKGNSPPSSSFSYFENPESLENFKSVMGDLSKEAPAFFKEATAHSNYLRACQILKEDSSKSEEAFRFLELSAIDNYAPAKHDLAVMLKAGQGCKRDLKRSMALYRQAAEDGYAPAQNAMGSFFQFGNEVIQKNLDEAMNWYEKAYKQGYELAEANIERLLKEEE